MKISDEKKQLIFNDWENFRKAAGLGFADNGHPKCKSGHLWTSTESAAKILVFLDTIMFIANFN